MLGLSDQNLSGTIEGVDPFQKMGRIHSIQGKEVHEPLCYNELNLMGMG